MFLRQKTHILVFRRRVSGLVALAFGAAALLMPTLGAAQGMLERFKEDIKGELGA